MARHVRGRPRGFHSGPTSAPSPTTDRPLPIGEGQTISQPYIVAVMVEAPESQGDDTVLEIGTGSGYVAALLLENRRRGIHRRAHRAPGHSAPLGS